MLLEGLQLPLTTPFYADGRLNLRKLEQNVAAYSKSPAAGLAVLTKYGEASALSDEETIEVLEAAIQAAAPEKTMLAGISRGSVLGTVALADHAARLGYDAALVSPPSFLLEEGEQRGRELLTYFLSLADRSAIPLVIAGEVPEKIVAELAQNPRMIGAVRSGGIADLQQATASVKHEVTVTHVFSAVTARMLARQKDTVTAEMLAGGTAVAVAPAGAALRTRTKTVGFQILAGSTREMLDGLLAGAVGVMPAFAACAPQACYEVFAAWKDGDHGLAEEKQARLNAVAEKVENELGVAAVKFGCDFNGYAGGNPRLPRLPLSAAERQEVESLMQGLRN
ncbi:MAG TPA: dihydrodipicolinate synthase family protein [Edaphobacter sp.]|nr:dihydrodipicolinate synthase family protein [Edaphobacter sp.]